MNKYQDALRRCKSDFEDRIDNNNILMVGRMDIGSLEELVDLATPRKPKEVMAGNKPYVYICENCGRLLPIEEYPFCPNCGQKIYWEVE